MTSGLIDENSTLIQIWFGAAKPQGQHEPMCKELHQKRSWRVIDINKIYIDHTDKIWIQLHHIEWSAVIMRSIVSQILTIGTP